MVQRSAENAAVDSTPGKSVNCVVNIHVTVREICEEE